MESIQPVQSHSFDISWIFSRIWPDEYTSDIQKGLVFVGRLRRVQDTTKTLHLLNTMYPLPELRHLKRVRQTNSSATESSENCSSSKHPEIIICQVFGGFQEHDTLKTNEVIQSEQLLSLLSDNLTVSAVCWTKPLSTHQVSASRALWPTVNPNPIVDPYKDSLAPERKVIFLKFFSYLRENGDAIDPLNCSTNSVIILDTRNPSHMDNVIYNKPARPSNNPLEHPVMQSISYIASRQLPYVPGKRQHSDPVNGILRSVSEGDGSYLCTGLDALMLMEPCVMCGMALVHARIFRVAFLKDNPAEGCLKSVYKFQGVRKLNHHFEVWQAFENSQVL